MKHYGLIILTLCYILVLVVIDQSGFFIRRTTDKINALPKTSLAGRVISYPETKSNRTEFYFQVKSGTLKINLLSRVYSLAEPVHFGDILEMSGTILPLPQTTNPGQFDYGKYLIRESISGIINVRDYKLMDKPGFFYRALYLLKDKMSDSITDNLPVREGSVLTKMFLGDRSGMDPYIREIFTDAGVMHTLVVSGLNVGYVIAVFWFILKLPPLSNKARQLLLIPPVVAYCFITGANPPITRATIMACAFIISYILKRDSLVYHTFSLAALIILLINPQALFSASMQLSFAACIGIVYITPKLNDIFFNDSLLRHNQIARFMILLFFTSLASQLATAPLLAYYFYKVSFIALFSNLIVVPLVGIILILCFILFFSSIVTPFFTPVFAVLTKYFTAGLIATVDFFAGIPGATMNIGRPSILFIIIYYSVLILIFKLKEVKYKIIGAAAFIIFILVSLNFDGIHKSPLTVTFLDVGLGDCIFIRTPDNKNVFIDCGGGGYNNAKWIIEPFLLSQGIKTIDKIIITTGDWTHFQGLKALLEDFNVRRVCLPAGKLNPELAGIIQSCRYKDIEIDRQPKELYYGNVSFEFYNASALITKIAYGDTAVLLTSDAKEKEILGLKNKIGEVDILQYPHHATIPISDEILRKFKPEYIIASTSRKGLFCQGSKLFSTYSNGAITIQSNGKTYRITSVSIGG